MALDRQSIEKKDFPIARRGYEPDAVNAHLRALADEIEALHRSDHPRGESPAAGASEQVRSIVEAAEATAADTQRQAEDEARESRPDGSGQAGATLERIDAIQNELGELIESLRTGSTRLNADLRRLEGNLASVKAAVQAAPPGRANGTEDESARLVALNMVMNDTPREEIERYLAEHFRLTDRGGLLDDIYSSFQD